MKDIYEIIKQIQATSGRNDKEELIRKGQSVNGFKGLVKFAFDPFIIFGIGTKKLNKFLKQATGENNEFTDLYKLLLYLSINNTGDDYTLKKVCEFLAAEKDEELRQFYSEVITKTLKIGATAKSVNKAFGQNFIPEFSCMLAKKFEDHAHKIKGEFGVTLKLDGIRALVIKEDGILKFFSRQGQSIDQLVELIEDFDKLPDNMVYDGELLLVNDKGLDSDDLFRATQKVVRKDGEKRNVEFHMFDLLPLEEFKVGKSKKKYNHRMLDLHEWLDLSQTKFIKKVPILYWGTDKNKIYEWLDKVVDDGKEGLMVSNGDGYYVTKRSDSLLKVKKMHTVDLKVIDVEEGTGKNKGKLGALVVDYKGFPCGVGSGYSDQQREEFWQQRDNLIGRVIEVQYFEESTNQNGGLSLRFPVFKMVRELGKEVSYE